MSTDGSIRGPEDVTGEVRDEMCGRVARAVLAATGETCTRRSVGEVATQLDAIRGVRVDRAESAEEQHDDRDFIDLTITRGSSAGQMFLVLIRNGFVPEAMAGNWQGGTPEGEEGRVVLQFKR